MSEENARITLNWILETLKERQKEAETEMNKNTSDSFMAGRALAYTEMLEIAENRTEILKNLE